MLGENKELLLHEVSDTFDLNIKNTDDGIKYQIKDVHLGMEMRDLLKKIYDQINLKPEDSDLYLNFMNELRVFVNKSEMSCVWQYHINKFS